MSEGCTGCEIWSKKAWSLVFELVDAEIENDMLRHKVKELELDIDEFQQIFKQQIDKLDEKIQDVMKYGVSKVRCDCSDGKIQ